MSASLKKILIVDDEQHFLSAMRRRYHKKYEIVTSTSGREAIDLIESEGAFSVIISDLQMPGMSGLEFLRLVRKISSDSICIMLTGFAELNAAVNAVNQGHVFRFLTKPCADDVLDEAIAEAVDEYRRQTTVKSYTYSMRLVDGEYVCESRSAGCVAVTGYSNQDFYRDPEQQNGMILPEYRAALRNAFEQLLGGDEVKPVEFQIKRKDGGLRWLRETLIPHRSEAGKVEALDGYVEDISEKKEIQRALIASEARYQRLVENSPGLVFQMVLNDDGQLVFTFVSESARELFDLEPDEIMANSGSFTDRLDADDRTKFFELVRKSSKTFEPLEWWGSGQFKSQKKLFQAVARPEIMAGRDVCWHGLLMDMTELRKIENQMRSLARLAAENPNPVLRVDAEDRIIYANQESGSLLDEWGTRRDGKLPEELAEYVQAARKAGETIKIELEWQGRRFELTLTPVSEENCVNMYVNSTDHIYAVEKELASVGEKLKKCDRELVELMETFASEIKSSVPAMKSVLANGFIRAAARISKDLRHEVQSADAKLDELYGLAEKLSLADDLELGLTLAEIVDLAKEAATKSQRTSVEKTDVPDARFIS